MTTPDDDMTTMLTDARSGDPRAADALLEAIYDRLRAIAEEKLKAERSGHTLQATALVHEAYMKLVDQTRVDWVGRAHFCAVAAQAMRRILIDHARGHKREKRGGNRQPVTLHDAYALTRRDELDLIALNDALERMRELDERQAKVAELRLLGGLTMDETARMLDLPKRTAEREWKMGRAWLQRELRKSEAE